MEESEVIMNIEDVTNVDSPLVVKKPKKRSLVERELETSLTSRITSPAIIADGLSTSRYGRARRSKIQNELIDSQKFLMASIKPLENQNTPVKVQSPVYRMHASNSPLKSETPIKLEETYLDNQIDNIYQENISLSRFANEPGSPSSAKKIPKVYIRKDLLQKREAEETIMLIKNLFSPTNSTTKSSYSTNLEFSSENIVSKQNGYLDNTSVVKTLDFDGNKKVKKENKDQKQMSKNELFELEAKCHYQVGDLAWARMGTFPFWPCIITRDPYSEMFVKKKLFGRVEHDILHVTFFGDNGRRSWIVDNMLRNYLGQLEFEATRAKFTLEDKKKDPRLYAAYFVSDKKQALWNTSVEEAESLLRHPKRLRVDIFNDMLLKFRASKKNQKSGKITRTDSDVSLSESLYDSLFSEEELKTDDAERSKNRSRNKSFDVSDVVTACLDNMAAKTGITKIQRQSHMDRWLQKAKSKTPEKNQKKGTADPLNADKSEKQVIPPVVPKLDTKLSDKSKKPPTYSVKPYRLRKGNESESKLTQVAHDESKNGSNEDVIILDDISNNIHENSSTIIIDDTSDTDIVSNSKINPSIDDTKPVQAELSNIIEEIKQDTLTILSDTAKNSDFAKVPSLASKSKKKRTPLVKRYKLRKISKALTKLTQTDVDKNRSKSDIIMADISNNFNVDVEIESLSDKDNEEPSTIMSVDYTSNTVTKPKVKLGEESTTDVFQPNSKLSESVIEVKQDTMKIPAENDKKSDDTIHPVKVSKLGFESKKMVSTTPQVQRYRLRRSSEAQTKLTQNVVEKNCSMRGVIVVENDISNNFNVDVEIEPLSDKDKFNEEPLTMPVDHTSDTFTKSKGELDSATKPVQASKSKNKPSTAPPVKRYRLRRSSKSQSKLTQHDEAENSLNKDVITIDEISNNFNVDVEIDSLTLKDKQETPIEMSVDQISDTVAKPKDEPDFDDTTKPVKANSELSDNVVEVTQNTIKIPTESDKDSEDTINSVRVPTLGQNTVSSVKRYRLRRTDESRSKLTQHGEGNNRSKCDVVMVDDISNNINVEPKVESLSVINVNVDPSMIMSVYDNIDTDKKPKDKPSTDNTTQTLQAKCKVESVIEVKQDTPIMLVHKDKMSDNMVHPKKKPYIGSQNKDVPPIITPVKHYRLRRSGESQSKLPPHDKSKDKLIDDIIVVNISNNIHEDGKAEALADDIATISSVDGILDSVTKPKNELDIDTATSLVHINSNEDVIHDALLMPVDENDMNFKDTHQKSEPGIASVSKKKTPAVTLVKRYRLRRSGEYQSKLAVPDAANKISKDDVTMVDVISDNVNVDGKVEAEVHKSKSLHDDTFTITPVDDTSESLSKLNQHELAIDNSIKLVQDNISETVNQDILTLPADNHKKIMENKPFIPSVKLFRLRRTKSKLTQDETNRVIENMKIIEGISNTIHENDNKIESVTKTIIEDINLDTSTKLSDNEKIPACILNSKEDPPKENSGISDTHKTSGDSVDMEVDQDTNNLQEYVQGCSIKTDSSIAAMKVVDENVNMEEKKCMKFETVSNDCVEDNKLQLIHNHSDIKSAIPGLQEAQNVSIEASVTETKNDDILINQEEERQQESNKPETSINKEAESNIDFLDVSISHKTNIAILHDKTQETLGLKSCSIPDKFVNLSTLESNKNLTSISSNELNFEEISLNRGKLKNQNVILSDKILTKQPDYFKTDIIQITNEIEDQKDDPTKVLADKSIIGQHINDGEMAVGDDNDVLNMSGNSESILQENYEVDNLPVASSQISSESEFNTSFNESNASESILDCIQASVNSAEKTINNKLDDTTKLNSICEEENHDCSTRPYVESPTFTQLLESEEFFRDVNETYEIGNNHENKSHDNYLNECSVKNVVENGIQAAHENPDQNVGADYEDEEDTSEDEPSPEYESLDEDITEDFRKHMMSIESNITDKKDEEQIVKICNEIAEKAKLSPTKNTIDIAMDKTKDKHEKNSEDKIDALNQKDILIISPKHNILDIHPKENLDMSIENKKSEVLKCTAITDEKNDVIDHLFAKTGNKHDNGVNNEIGPKIAGDPNLNDAFDKTEVNKDNSLKINYSATLKIGDPSLNDACDKTEVNKDNSLKINDDAALKKKSDECKIINKTCLAINSITKERATPDFIVKSSEIEQLRKSCEYDPKVVIIPLEKEATGLLKAVKNKSVKQEKSITKSNKYRLTLKRENTPTNVIALPAPILKLEESERFKSELPVKEEEMVNSNRVPKKMIIKNGAIETTIPEPVKEIACHTMNRKQTEASDLIDDTEFDIDTVSVNSEDSEISLPNSVGCVPRRNLRSRPERTLEYALKNPEFLKYLELRQDYLMDLHPDLDQDEVVIYVYKTWQYEEDLKADIKKTNDAHNSSVIKGPKQDTQSRKRSIKGQPKDSLENNLREKYENCKNSIEVFSETGLVTSDSCGIDKLKIQRVSPIDSGIEHKSKDKTEEVTAKRKTRSKSPSLVNLTSESNNDVILVKDKDLDSVSIKSEENLNPKRTLRSKVITPKSSEKVIKVDEDTSALNAKVKGKTEFDTESIDSEDSEVPLRELKSKMLKENEMICLEIEITSEKKLDVIAETKGQNQTTKIKEEDAETASVVSDNEPLQKLKKKLDKKSIEDPEFIEYMELRQDALIDENPQLTQEEIVGYLYKTWLYQESSKSDLKKNDELEKANLVKGLNDNEAAPPKKTKRRPKVEKDTDEILLLKDKPKRRIIQPYYNENFSDIEDELEVFEIFKTKESSITIVSKTDTDKDQDKSPNIKAEQAVQMPEFAPKIKEVYEVKDVKPVLVNEEGDKLNDEEVEYVDEIEFYFAGLTKPRPSVFKGLIREKVCGICMVPGNLVKCKGCNGMFHPDCVKRETETVDKDDSMLLRGRKKKKKQGRKTKSLDDSGSHSDEKSQDVSANMSVEDIVVPPEISTFDAESFETQLAAKMKELIDPTETNYDYYSSDDGIDWKESVAGKCEIVDVKLKLRSPPMDYSDFRCNNCQKYDVPVCFVCMAAVSKTNVKMRQKCHVAHCHMYYHLECLDHWPQTQFNAGEPSRNNKKINEFFEPLTCPRHVCHTCVSDDPRGCKTRFCGDKLARCVRCPATYHSFNKCLPAGTQILTASHILCPRHCDDRTAKVPCHVNTGWCFICALGGSLICCEYCPTSFHAECLNIKPPEGNYMCEDCETGRLPLYGEMVWVKLGHYRWWPGIILHPSEIPENIMAVKHSLGEFVVRFFGQYDHYWVNRGRVFPYQEGDTGRISGQKSKIDADFTLAIEHAQRAYTILKNAEPNEEESLDIASSLLPPHYVKLKCNKPCGSLCGRKVEDPSLSLTQCECNPDEPDPCGLYSQCLNRMLLTECGPTCRAGERCHNRAFEKRLYPKLVPYRTPHRGWGLKTLEHIRAGQFVIEYVGELIDEEEFKRRMRRKHEIRDENFYFLTLDKERMIDAGPKGNAARFMNHCCEPNCETQKWTVLGDVRVGLFAINDIPANSEVTFNYNLECTGIEKKRCLCGAKRCSGYIGAKPKQEESHSKKGKDGKITGKRPYNKKKKVSNQEESPSLKNKPKRPLGRPPKPKELTEIEKDLLIIKSATNTSSNESSRRQSLEDKNPKTLKRKRDSISKDEASLCNGEEPSVKKMKCEEKTVEVGD